MMNEYLEIFIITYNRCEHLKNTLETITEKNSPIKNCTIRIIDNDSSDRTSEICKFFNEKISNITYIKNHRNIGLPGNICRAMELAEKKYFWILCDNDELRFDVWNEIEQAMRDDYDLILASRFYFPSKYECFEALVLNQLTFLPSGIYKTKFMTNDVMCYAMLATWTVLPHLALGCKIINLKGKVFLPSDSIVTLMPNNELTDYKKYSFDRCSTSSSSLKNEYGKAINFYAGVSACVDACTDDNIRHNFILNFIDSDKLNGYGPFFDISIPYKKNMPNYIYWNFYYHMPIYFQRKINSKIRKILYIKKTQKYINLIILEKIKIRIWKQKWLFFL